MANPPAQHYVDPSIAGNSGAGTVGDPYGDLQYALDTLTPDTTHGDQINIKAGTDEVLTGALDLTTYGAPNQNAPLCFRGYTSTANDGGVGGIDCNENNLITNAGNSIKWVDLEIHNGPQSGTAAFLTVTFYGAVVNCYIHNTDGYIICGDDFIFFGNRLENIGNSSNGLLVLNEGVAAYNYIDVVTGTRDPLQVMRMDSVGASAIGNILYLDSDANGIRNHAGGRTQNIIGNTILANAGTGTGIILDASSRADCQICCNNYVEGFSGTGGIGYLQSDSSENGGLLAYNAAYNNATNYSIANEHAITIGSTNETLSATGLAKSGALTFANRLAYFAPADEGAMRTGGVQAGVTS